MNNLELTYLIVHGISTIGGLFVFLLRVEHRITRLETKVELMEKKIPC
jgi:hypothetical protein